MAHPSSASLGGWWKALANGEHVECRDQDGAWSVGVIKNQSKGGGVSVHLVGRDTSLDRKLELSDCHSQLQPLWSSEYDDATLRYLEGKGVLGPDGAEGAVQPDAAVAEEHKAYPATPWLTASSSADSAVGGSSSGAGIRVAQATSDASWYLAQPRMWVEGIDADGAWWPANITQSHPVKGVNLHFLGKSPADDKWVEPAASGTLLRPLPRIKSTRYSDELWDELQRRMSKQAKQPVAAVAAAVSAAPIADERKDPTAVAPMKVIHRIASPATPLSTGDTRVVTPLPAKRKAVKSAQTATPPTVPSITTPSPTDIRRALSSTSSSSSPTKPAPPNGPMQTPLTSSPSHTTDYNDTAYTTPGKEEAHPLSVTHSKRAIVEQINAMQSRHEDEMAQLRNQLADVRLDNSRLQNQLLGRAPQPPPPAGGADLLIVHTLHERYNRAMGRLESESPAVSDELLSELRGLVDWHLEMTGRLNRLLRAKEAELSVQAPSYH